MMINGRGINTTFIGAADDFICCIARALDSYKVKDEVG